MTEETRIFWVPQIADPNHVTMNDLNRGVRLDRLLVEEPGHLPPVDILDRIDRAVDGLCPCGAGPREGSTYCSYDCEPNIRGEHTDLSEAGAHGLATPMRWRPDLITAAPDEDLTPFGTQQRPVNGFFRSAFRRSNGTVHLRLDDGYRFVGCDVSEEHQGPEGYSTAWKRLERELGNTRHVVAGEMHTAMRARVVGDNAAGRIMHITTAFQVSLRPIQDAFQRYERLVAEYWPREDGQESEDAASQHPMLQAIEARRQQRNGGPQRRERAPRRIDPRRSR